MDICKPMPEQPVGGDFETEESLRGQIRQAVACIREDHGRQTALFQHIVTTLRTHDDRLIRKLQLSEHQWTAALLYAVAKGDRPSVQDITWYGTPRYGEAIAAALRSKRFLVAYDVLHTAQSFWQHEVDEVRRLGYGDIADEMQSRTRVCV